MNSDKLFTDTIHAYKFSQQTKPLKAINNLTDELKKFAKPFVLRAESRMNLSQRFEDAYIVILERGCFSLVLKKDSLYLGTLFAPTITGLVDGYSLFYNVAQRPQHYIRAETDCQGWLIPIGVFVEQCDALCLWHDVARILAHRLMTLSAKEGEMVGTGAYSKIRTLLLELWLYPADARQHIGVSSFLQRRTKISKSRVHAILADLCKGGFIQLEGGKLVNLNKLPLVY